MPHITGALHKKDFYFGARYFVDYRPGGHGDDPGGVRFSDGGVLSVTEKFVNDESCRIHIPGFLVLAPSDEVCRDAVLCSTYALHANGVVAFYAPCDILYAIGRLDVSQDAARKYLEKGDTLAGLEVLVKTARAKGEMGPFSGGAIGWTRLGRTVRVEKNDTLTMTFDFDGIFRDTIVRMEKDRQQDWWCSISAFALGLKISQKK